MTFQISTESVRLTPKPDMIISEEMIQAIKSGLNLVEGFSVETIKIDSEGRVVINFKAPVLSTQFEEIKLHAETAIKRSKEL